MRYRHLHLKLRNFRVFHFFLSDLINLTIRFPFDSANDFNETKAKVEKKSGIRFKLKDLRSPLTSMTVNDDLSRMPAMRVQLRHQSPDTIRRFYASIKQGEAAKQLRNAGKQSPVYFTGPPLFESKTDILDKTSGGSARI